jgi:hypothetical protein
MTDDSLARRLQRLEDIEALKDLKHRYLQSADRHDLDNVRDCFAPEQAVIEFEGFPRCEGRDNLIAMMAEFGGKPGVYTMHHGHNPRFEFESDDRARGTWSLFYSSIDVPAQTIAEIAGVYHEIYTRRHGRWYIQHSRFERQSFLLQAIEHNTLKAAQLGPPPG